MFLQYINAKKSWLFFYLFMLGLVDFIVWLDEGIPIELSAMVYLNGLFLLLLVLFFMWRYRVEMAYVKELTSTTKEHGAMSSVTLPAPTFFQEQLIDEAMRTTIMNFEEALLSMKDQNLLESVYMTAWVHEVKAPLTAMKLMIDEDRHNPAMRKIEAEWLRIHLLIDRQLSIARLASHETDYILEHTYIQRLVSLEVKELASWCLEKRIAVEFEGDDIEAVTDEKWCRFIVRQILTNAVKYSPVDGLIHISFRENQSGNPQMMITDKGPGIEKHELPRVFEKGFTGGTGRLHNAATGLGLYLAREVAHKIGTKLSIQSEINRGTTVTLTFPTENDFDLTLK